MSLLQAYSTHICNVETIVHVHHMLCQSGEGTFAKEITRLTSNVCELHLHGILEAQLVIHVFLHISHTVAYIFSSAQVYLRRAAGQLLRSKCYICRLDGRQPCCQAQLVFGYRFAASCIANCDVDQTLLTMGSDRYDCTRAGSCDALYLASCRCMLRR